MEYILFAFLALFASVGNTIFNRLGSNHASALTNATIKSFFILLACFFISLVMGHVPTLYDLTLEQVLWILLVGALTTIDWLFYFFAIRKAHLEAFAPFCAAGILFASNSLFSIFTFASVTNGGKPLNIVFYFLGLASLLGSLIFIIFNKKINPKGAAIWVIFAVISVVSYAFVLLIVKTKLTVLPSDVVSYHQMTIVFIAMLLASLFGKNIKEMFTIKWLDFLYILFGAICNALMLIGRYTAFSYANCVPAIVNVIVSLDFIIVSIATILFFKAKNKLQLLTIIILVSSGMALDVLAGLI